MTSDHVCQLVWFPELSVHTVSPQVYVVELTRKPLFPGIYTPVHVSKNEKLIKEIMETKKQGSVLRDHWQHRV